MGQHLSMRVGLKRIVLLDRPSETVKRLDPKVVAAKCVLNYVFYGARVMNPS